MNKEAEKLVETLKEFEENPEQFNSLKQNHEDDVISSENFDESDEIKNISFLSEINYDEACKSNNKPTAEITNLINNNNNTELPNLPIGKTN